MPKVQVTLPDQVESEIQQLVQQGEFLNREQAVEELLSMGISAYDIGEDTTTEPDEELFTQAIEDQHDPAMQEDQDDSYTF